MTREGLASDKPKPAFLQTTVRLFQEQVYLAEGSGISNEQGVVYTLMIAFDKKPVDDITVQDLRTAHDAIMAETTKMLSEYGLDTFSLHQCQGTIPVGDDLVTFRWADVA